MSSITYGVLPTISTINPAIVNPQARAAGASQGNEQIAAVQALQRDGKLGLTGLLKLPGDVLFVQGEREAKVKLTTSGDRVASSSASDFDDERELEKFDDHTDITPRISLLKNRPGNQQAEANAGGAEDAAQKNVITSSIAHARSEAAQNTAEHTEEFAKFVNRSDAASEPAIKPADTNDRAGKRSVIGKPATTYTTLQAVLTPPSFDAPDGDAYAGLDVLA